MNRLRASLLTLATLALSTSAHAQWTQLNGPEAPVVSAIETDGSTILLGTNEADAGELFRSTDGGRTWSNAGFPNGGVGELLVDGDNWLMGLYIDGIYRSTDGGFSWTRVQIGLTADVIHRHGPNLFTGESLFGAQSIYRSSNDGATWSPIPGSPMLRVLSFASRGSQLYVGSQNNGMYRSTDDGASWTQVTSLPTAAAVSAMCVLDGDIYAAVRNIPATHGVFRSTDGGTTWTQLPQSPIDHFGDDLHRLVARDGDLYAGVRGTQEGGIYRSTNLGVTWEQLDEDLPGDHRAGDFLLGFDGDGTILAGMEDGIYRTEDDAENWTESGQGTGAIRGVDSMLDRAGTLYVGLQTNGGQGRGIWKSSDLGSTWSHGSGVGESGHARALCNFGSEILAGMYVPRGIYRSSDEGQSWAPSTTGISPSTVIHDIFVDGGTLWVGAHEALYRSTNDGVSWTAVAGISEALTILRFGDRLLVGTGNAGIRSTTNGGMSWGTFDNGLPAGIVQKLAIVDGTLFAALWSGGIYRLEGETWVPTSRNSGFHQVLEPVGRVLVTQSVLDYQVLYSTDLGETWNQFQDGFFGEEIYEMTVSGGHLIAGTRGYGIWSRPISDLPGASSVPEDPSSVLSSNGLQLRVSPNPISQHATFAFELPTAGRVRLALYDVQGREVAELWNAWKPAGLHQVRIEPARARMLPVGALFARLEMEGRAPISIRVTQIR
jgi:photosystem II stability/assembly factor-like uncharacterized protein